MYDTIIIGSGIAGLLTALRLSLSGQTVLIVDKDKIGTGSTMSNHGMVHSGALFVRQHGHVVKHCQEAQPAFTELLSEAEIACEGAIYIAKQDELEEFTKRLYEHSFAYHPVKRNALSELSENIDDSYHFISIKERAFSSKKILSLLVSYCTAQGITFLTGTKVQKILIKGNKVTGIQIGKDEVITASHIIISAGLGTTQLLETFNSYYCKDLKSRLDMMVYLPQAKLKRGFIFAELHRPILIPAIDNTVLGSYFGGIQPIIKGERKFAVNYDKAHNLMSQIKTFFNEAFVNTEETQIYMCGKTDYVGTEKAEKGFINPGFHIIDHSNEDSIKNLYTIVTGKMTLAFHASQLVAEYVLGTKVPLVIPKQKRTKNAEELVTVEPWSDVNSI